MTKPSSGLPREKRMSWIADKPAGQTRKRKGTVKTNPNTQTAPLSPIKGSLDIWCRSCDVTAVGRATGRTLLTPSPIMFYPDGIARTGMQRQQLLPGTHQQGFQEHGHLQAHWHGLYFQCVKAKAFNEGILLGPARPQALLVKTPRDRHMSLLPFAKGTMQYHRGYGVSAPCTGSSHFQSDLGREANQTNISVFHGAAAA